MTWIYARPSENNMIKTDSEGRPSESVFIILFLGQIALNGDSGYRMPVLLSLFLSYYS